VIDVTEDTVVATLFTTKSLIVTSLIAN